MKKRGVAAQNYNFSNTKYSCHFVLISYSCFYYVRTPHFLVHDGLTAPRLLLSFEYFFLTHAKGSYAFMLCFMSTVLCNLCLEQEKMFYFGSESVTVKLFCKLVTLLTCFCQVACLLEFILFVFIF
jgi:hypothetical protein